jgi:hypothetical protein
MSLGSGAYSASIASVARVRLVGLSTPTSRTLPIVIPDARTSRFFWSPVASGKAIFTL